jgi:hypothetical protein
MFKDFELRMSSAPSDTVVIDDQCNQLHNELTEVFRDELMNLNRLEQNQNQYGDQFDAIYDVLSQKLDYFEESVYKYLNYKREDYLTRNFNAYRTNCLNCAKKLLESLIEKNMHLPLKVILNRKPDCLQMQPDKFLDRYSESAWLMMQDICMTAIKGTHHIYLFLLEDDWSQLQQQMQKDKDNFLRSLEEQFTQRQSILGTDLKEAMPGLRAWVVDRSIMPVPFPIVSEAGGDIIESLPDGGDDVVRLDSRH